MEQHAGAYRAEKYQISASGASDARWIQAVAVQPHTSYRLSGWIKTKDVAHINDNVDPGATLGLLDMHFLSAGVFGTHDWTRVSYEFNSGPRTQVTVAARLGFWSRGTTGTAWFDDVTLQAIAVTLKPINLLANPGADDGLFPSPSLPNGWSTEAFDPDAASFAWDLTQAYAGARSVRISASGPNDAYWLQTVAVQPHTSYRLSGWVKTKDVAHTSDSVDAGANLALLGTWTRSGGVFGTRDWTYVSLEFNSESETQVTIAARLGFWSGTTTGTTWFDSLKLEPSGRADLLSNGDFERGTYVRNGPPMGWVPQARNPARALFEWDKTVYYLSGKSMKLQLSARSSAGWLQSVSVLPNTEYRFTGWIKTARVAHSGQSRDLGAFLAVDELGAFSPAIFGTHDWQYISMTFNSGSRRHVTVAGRLGHADGPTTGTVWFDGLRLAPVRPVDHPRWQILVLIYGTTDLSYTDSSGLKHHVIGTMTQAEQARAAAVARRFAGADVPALTSGNMYPSLTIRYPRHPLTKFDRYGDGWYPSFWTVEPERTTLYDSVIVIWTPWGVDQASGVRAYLAGAAGLTLYNGTGQTYLAINADLTSYNNRNIFKHEWGHSILFYYDAAGTAPRPTVDNHVVLTHCPTGAPYIMQDENDDHPIPNSIYNNDSGFAHDYYSGTTATPDRPQRCLGITPQAWASGGPVWSGGMFMTLSDSALEAVPPSTLQIPVAEE